MRAGVFMFLFLLLVSCGTKEPWRMERELFGFHLGGDWTETSNQISSMIISNEVKVEHWVGKTTLWENIELNRFDSDSLPFIRLNTPQSENGVKRLTLTFADSDILTNTYLVKIEADLKDETEITLYTNQFSSYKRINTNESAPPFYYQLNRRDSSVEVKLDYTIKSGVLRAVTLSYYYADFLDYLLDIEAETNN